MLPSRAAKSQLSLETWHWGWTSTSKTVSQVAPKSLGHFILKWGGGDLPFKICGATSLGIVFFLLLLSLAPSHRKTNGEKENDVSSKMITWKKQSTRRLNKTSWNERNRSVTNTGRYHLTPTIFRYVSIHFPTWDIKLLYAPFCEPGVPVLPCM